MIYKIGEFVVVKELHESHATQGSTQQYRKLNSRNIPLLGIVERITINNSRPDETIYTLRVPHGYRFSCVHGDDLNNFAARMLESIDQTTASELFEIAASRAT